MSTINALIFSNSPKIDLANEVYQDVKPSKELREVLAETFEPYSDYFINASNVWQRKFIDNQVDQVNQFLQELLLMRELKAVVYVQTSGAIFNIGELDIETNDWEFYLDFLLGWNEENGILTTSGAEFLGYPDLVINSSQVSDPITMLKETFDHIKGQPLPIQKQYLEWNEIGKFRLQENERLGYEKEDPFFNAAGTYQLIKSL